MSKDQSAEILERAADLIEHEGWTRGTFSMYGRRCLVGALNRATRVELGLSAQARSRIYRMAKVRPVKLVIDVIGAPTYDHVDDPMRRLSHLEGEAIKWNDNEDRQKQEVLDALRKAAKHARGVID